MLTLSQCSIRLAMLAALFLVYFPIWGCNARLHSQKGTDHDTALESSNLVRERRVQVDNWLALQSSLGTTLPPLYERLNCPLGHTYVTTHLALLIEGVVPMSAGLTDFLAYTYRNQTIQSCDPNFRVIVDGPLLLDAGSSQDEGVFLYELGVGGYGSTPLFSALEPPSSTRRLNPAVPGTVLDQQIGQLCNILQIMDGENWGSCVDCPCPYDGCYCPSPDATPNTIDEMEFQAALNDALQVPRDAIISQILGDSSGITQVAALRELQLNDCSMCPQTETTFLAHVNVPNFLDSNRAAIEREVAQIINEYNCLNQGPVFVVGVEASMPGGRRRLQAENLYPIEIRITSVSTDASAAFASTDTGDASPLLPSALRCALDTGTPYAFFSSSHADGTGDTIPLSMFEDLLSDFIMDLTAGQVSLIEMIDDEIYFEREQEEACPATDTTYDAFFGIQLSNTIVGALNPVEREGLEMSLEAAYVNATLTSCDLPFFRSLIGSPNLIFPTEGAELLGTLGTTTFLVFQLSVASRGTPQLQTALHPPLSSGVVPTNRRLQDLCTLQDVLDGPLTSDCNSGGSGCDCARDGCYCLPEFAAVPRGATENELLFELNNFIQSAAPNALARIQEGLPLAELIELEEQQCSNDGGGDFQDFRVALVVFFDSDPSLWASDENALFEIGVRDIMNDFNFQQCDSTFTTISDVNVVSQNNNVPSGNRKHRSLAARRSYPLTSSVTARSRDRMIFRSSGKRTLHERTLHDESLEHVSTTYSRANRSRSLITLQDDDTVRCFCPAFGEGSGEAISQTEFVTTLNNDIQDGLLGDFRPLVVDAVEAEIEDCPNDGIRVPVSTTVLLRFTESLTPQQINDLELDCLTGYNELSIRNCDPASTRISSCTFFPADFDGPDADSRGVLRIEGFAFTAMEDPIHFDTNFRRLSETNAKPHYEDDRYLDIARALQDTDLCFCPGGDDAPRSAVSLLEFLEVTNTAGTMSDAVVVEEVPCEVQRSFSLMLSVTLTGVSAPLSPENLDAVERQLVETINELSIEGCDEGNIFATSAMLLLDGFTPVVACGTVRLDGFCYGEGCENFVLGGNGRRLRSIERRMQRALNRISTDGPPSGLREQTEGSKRQHTSEVQPPNVDGRASLARQLQSFESQCFCSYDSVRSNIRENVSLDDINTRLSNSSPVGGITSVSLSPSSAPSACIVEEIIEEEICDEVPGMSMMSRACGKSSMSNSGSGGRRRRLNKKRSTVKRRRM